MGTIKRCLLSCTSSPRRSFDLPYLDLCTCRKERRRIEYGRNIECVVPATAVRTSQLSSSRKGNSLHGNSVQNNRGMWSQISVLGNGYNIQHRYSLVPSCRVHHESGPSLSDSFVSSDDLLFHSLHCCWFTVDHRP